MQMRLDEKSGATENDPDVPSRKRFGDAYLNNATSSRAASCYQRSIFRLFAEGFSSEAIDGLLVEMMA